MELLPLLLITVITYGRWEARFVGKEVNIKKLSDGESQKDANLEAQTSHSKMTPFFGLSGGWSLSSLTRGITLGQLLHVCGYWVYFQAHCTSNSSFKILCLMNLCLSTEQAQIPLLRVVGP